MKASSQSLFTVVVALASLNCLAAARSEELLKIAPDFAKSVVVEGASAGNFRAIIGNPKIADFTFGPRNAFWFIGKTKGRTNVIVLDNSTGNEIYSATIEVGDEAGRVQNHNKALVNSYTVYRCTPTCVYVEEVTSKEPASLPKGHIQSSTITESGTTQSSTRIQSDTTIQTQP